MLTLRILKVSKVESETKSLFETVFDDGEENASQATKTRALKILGSRQMSAANMERRLIEKGENEIDAANAVAWLIRLGAINDSIYALSISKHYLAKGYGIARIKDELYKRGIPKELWEEALSIADEDEMDEAILAFLEKKLCGSTEQTDLRRASDALIRRGYGYEDVKSAINRYKEQVQNREC